jgi:excisionase family DNA binding protein
MRCAPTPVPNPAADRVRELVLELGEALADALGTPTAPPLDEVLTLKEAAERIGLSRSALQRKRAAGEIQSIQISPRRYVIAASEIRRYLTERTR